MVGIGLLTGASVLPPPAAAQEWSAGVQTPSSRHEEDRTLNPARPLLYSALLPGAGQYVLQQRRGFAYLALEVVGWWFWLDRRDRGLELRRGYRDLAWRDARIPGGEERRDGDFNYYEALGHWSRSGAWDADPATSALEPESDPATYNGSMWLLARQIYFPGGPGAEPDPSDPAWDRALDYYRERAYGPAFLWDWTRHPGSREQYVEMIHASDERLRQATIALGTLVANHLISAADAFVSARLREATGDRVDAALGWAPPVSRVGVGRGTMPPLRIGVRVAF